MEDPNGVEEIKRESADCHREAEDKAEKVWIYIKNLNREQKTLRKRVPGQKCGSNRKRFKAGKLTPKEENVKVSLYPLIVPSGVSRMVHD